MPKFTSAQFLLALSEQSALCTFFSLLPPGLTALLRSAGFCSRAVFFAQMTLARSAFHGFQIGFKRCKEAWSTTIILIYVPTAIIETGHLLAANCPQTSRMKALKLFVQSTPLFFLSNRLLKIQPISIKF